MTSPEGHRLDVPELLLAHLGDDALMELRALLSRFCPRMEAGKIAEQKGKSLLQQVTVRMCVSSSVRTRNNVLTT